MEVPQATTTTAMDLVTTTTSTTTLVQQPNGAEVTLGKLDSTRTEFVKLLAQAKSEYDKYVRPKLQEAGQKLNAVKSETGTSQFFTGISRSLSTFTKWDAITKLDSKWQAVTDKYKKSEAERKLMDDAKLQEQSSSSSSSSDNNNGEEGKINKSETLTGEAKELSSEECLMMIQQMDGQLSRITEKISDIKDTIANSLDQFTEIHQQYARLRQDSNLLNPIFVGSKNIKSIQSRIAQVSKESEVMSSKLTDTIDIKFKKLLLVFEELENKLQIAESGITATNRDIAQAPKMMDTKGDDKQDDDNDQQEDQNGQKEEEEEEEGTSTGARNKKRARHHQ